MCAVKQKLSFEILYTKKIKNPCIHIAHKHCKPTSIKGEIEKGRERERKREILPQAIVLFLFFGVVMSRIEGHIPGSGIGDKQNVPVSKYTTNVLQKEVVNA